uniref:Uncharacterized protein n=1 Tax=Kalanchoe fedtschenkoi TaxID=63787 RepID=A0A7N0U5Q9_KALFE
MPTTALLCLLLAELCLSSSSSSLGVAGDSNLRSGSWSVNRRLAGGMSVMRPANEASEPPAEAAVYLDVEGPVGELKARHVKKRSRGVDTSVAGGGVILGGLATTFLVAIFCYIRATKRKATAKTLSDAASSAH